MEEEFIRNQEQMKPLEEKQEVEGTKQIVFLIRKAKICTTQLFIKNTLKDIQDRSNFAEFFNIYFNS